MTGAMSFHLVALGVGRPPAAAWKKTRRLAGLRGTFSYSAWSDLWLGMNSPVRVIHSRCPTGPAISAHSLSASSSCLVCP